MNIEYFIIDRVEEAHGVPVALKTPRINEKQSDFKMTVYTIIRLQFFFLNLIYSYL